MSRLIGYSSNLVMLGLAENKISDNGTKEFFKELTNNTYLKYLDYSGNTAVSDEGVIAISENLLKNTCLEIIDLYDIPFGNKGA